MYQTSDDIIDIYLTAYSSTLARSKIHISKFHLVLFFFLHDTGIHIPLYFQLTIDRNTFPR